MMNIDERDDTNDSSLGAPGEEPRATMVPPTSLSTYVSSKFFLRNFVFACGLEFFWILSIFDY